ncbi:MAG TPA: hypothetical protein VFS21_31005 [Roseiflexaceae bacterium]|nr:hypothetical protein [Roseiflexaceae bacterium]
MSEGAGRRRRGSTPKGERVRLELYWPDDAMLAELRQEAELRGVSVQQHIRDLLIARHLARHGVDPQSLLWIPTSPAPAAAVPAEAAAPAEEDEATAAARALKASLLSQLDDDDED